MANGVVLLLLCLLCLVSLAVAAATLVTVRRLQAQLQAARPASPAHQTTPAVPQAARVTPTGRAVAARDDVLTPTPLGTGELVTASVRTFALSSAVSSSLVKVAALTYGLRRALDEQSRLRVGDAFHRELRRQRRLRRRRAKSRPARDPGRRL